MKCIVKSCGNKYHQTQREGRKISFFRLPKDDVLKTKWLEILKIKCEVGFYTRVCSEHFQPKFKILQRNNAVKLADDALPDVVQKHIESDEDFDQYEPLSKTGFKSEIEFEDGNFTEVNKREITKGVGHKKQNKVMDTKSSTNTTPGSSQFLKIEKSCFVPNCGTTKQNFQLNNKETFKFPKNPELNAKWLAAIGKRESPTLESWVCSDHFDANTDFGFVMGKKIVKSGRIPSLLLGKEFPDGFNHEPQPSSSSSKGINLLWGNPSTTSSANDTSEKGLSNFENTVETDIYTINHAPEPTTLKIFDSRITLNQYIKEERLDENIPSTLDTSPKITDVSPLCRVCLEEKVQEKMFKIFSKLTIKLSTSEIVVQLDKILSELGDIKIDPEDEFPKKICEECIARLTTSYLFREQCKSSDLALTKHVHKLQEITRVYIMEPKIPSEEEPNLISKVEIDDDIEEIPTQDIFEVFEVPEKDEPRKKPKEIKYKCERCPFKSNSLFLWTSHKKRHVYYTDSFECTICSKRISKSYRERHMVSHTGVKKYVCSFCDVLKPSKQNVKFHMRYACAAAKEYFTREGMDEEADTNYDNGFKVEPRDDGKWVYRISRDEWLKAHKFQCPTCEKKFNTEHNMSQHVCILAKKRRKLEDALREVLCQECGKTCSSKEAYYLHMQKHSMSAKYPCERCEKKFHKTFLLREHVLTVHKIDIGYSIKCPMCHLTFTTPETRLAHLKADHKDWSPVSCSFCGKECVNNDRLANHIHLRHSGKEYKCGQCDQIFDTRLKFMNHQLKHTGGSNATNAVK